jgi:S-adenosylmethionine uptake transporter
MTSPRHDPVPAFIVGVLGIALFSAMDAVMKGLVITIGAYATVLWRNVAGVFLSGALYALKRSPWPSRATMNIHLARGVLSAAMAFLFFWGLGRVPLAQAIALAFIAPLIALYLAAAILKEDVSRRIVSASVIAFAGVLVIFFGQARADLGPDATLGSLSILASAACYALNIILMRRQALVAEPIEIAFFQSVIVAATLALLIPVVGVALPPAGQWPWLVLAAILATASLILLSWAYARAEANYLATTEYTSFLWAALFGWLFFDEGVSLYTLAGAGLIVAGCVLAARRPGEASPVLEAAA